ncbi:response regulator transcription factor [Pelagerythrobacter rhizovicinus]|uniref:Response regulator transcription factor n=1 Tax=Pelagerythrobacter rhizovicinus TaxID=2268576 RepID=A0A4Q2KKZ1_9SPHN|nr:response regulator transcription factor [Pelagerythrobacter rhizovicinus]RXZ65974.1 response regulator transcription factor [Pelagerythrobacter rhizovicinus]
MRIAILEDDPTVAVQLSETLSTAGHHCFAFESGRQLMKFLRSETADVVLLDWNIPDASGLEVARWMNKTLEPPPPIVMITVRSVEEDILAAFRVGIDDYVTKPVQPAVLLARIEAVARRAYPEPPKNRSEQFGRYRFDTQLKQIRLDGEAIPVTRKEFALALLLFHNLNRSLSRSYIFEAVWGGNPDIQTRTVDTHISKVRAKLKLRAEHGFRVVPLYGYGYRLEPTG